MSKPILYLMSKYSGREAESLKENQDAWLALDAKGFTVYSPICESHHIEEYRKTQRICLNHSKSGYCRVHCDGLPDNSELDGNSVCYGQKGIEKESIWKEPDYVARDLAKIEAFMGKKPCDAMHYLDCSNCCYYNNTNNTFCEWKPNVVGVVLPSVKMEKKEFITTSYFSGQLMALEDSVTFNSKGVREEYYFMHDHHILVISLETALTVPQEQWEEYGL